MKRILRNIVALFILFVVLAGVFAVLGEDETKKVSEVPFSTVVSEVNEDQVEKITIRENELEITLKNGELQTSRKEKEASLTESLRNSGVPDEKIRAIDVDIQDPTGAGVWLGAILPYLIPFLFLALIIYFFMRQVQGGNNRALSFGQSGARLSDQANGKKRVTFEDVAGALEAKEELKEVVEFLRTPHKFLSLGARIPKGVLLLGSPGVGKTLLARAVAGEANVPFFHISGSEFVEMFVGVGASRVRDLFKKAKKQAPAIVFIDEIDAVGRQRGTGLGGSHDEREQTLNQILVEMDGFEQDSSVIVMAATNRPDVLDPALLRPGRFDRQVIIDLPDISEREEILKVHARGKPIAEKANLHEIAIRTPGFSGADLSNLLNEAAILTARQNKKIVGMSEMIEAIEKVMLGPERRSHVLSVPEKKITAYHEAGHALVAAILPNAHYVHKISIISRGRAAGYTMKLPIEERKLLTKSEILDDLAVALGGYVTEQMFFNELTTGASNDLQQATGLARKLVMIYGMSEEIGPVAFGDKHELVFLGREIGEQKNYSEEIAAKIDKEITRFIRGAETRAKEIIAKNKAKMDEIANLLIKQETIERQEFETIMGDLIPTEKRNKAKTEKDEGVVIAPGSEKVV
ncbi:MAG: cell division protein FtsH [Candidatus Doudnabacteria bacterium RIFCSPHIGHO2_02_FULL_46_11]|uniref:ATP-dependent zinc metalloprotease FtsH n=1 Tax=Candidatus Doudnabacteria bacterium RIFCSPHIGHO2_02_FULL_46_11 TaxID=1817832 RepID=A0A1F5P8W6_9BACT|nr:MAG: cell division protein FtsH [Candidatus Doudnabacteria bacterium RIFCSPHIGHO2_02_FULL_46_11]